MVPRTEPAERCCLYTPAGLVHSHYHSPNSAPSHERGGRAAGCTRPARAYQQHHAQMHDERLQTSSVSMRSASTVDAAIERTCDGDTYRAQTPVSAIGRGRGGAGGAPQHGRPRHRGMRVMLRTKNLEVESVNYVGVCESDPSLGD